MSSSTAPASIQAPTATASLTDSTAQARSSLGAIASTTVSSTFVLTQVTSATSTAATTLQNATITSLSSCSLISEVYPTELLFFYSTDSLGIIQDGPVSTYYGTTGYCGDFTPPDVSYTTSYLFPCSGTETLYLELVTETVEVTETAYILASYNSVLTSSSSQLRFCAAEAIGAVCGDEVCPYSTTIVTSKTQVLIFTTQPPETLSYLSSTPTLQYETTFNSAPRTVPLSAVADDQPTLVYGSASSVTNLMGAAVTLDSDSPTLTLMTTKFVIVAVQTVVFAGQTFTFSKPTTLAVGGSSTTVSPSVFSVIEVIPTIKTTTLDGSVLLLSDPTGVIGEATVSYKVSASVITVINGVTLTLPGSGTALSDSTFVYTDYSTVTTVLTTQSSQSIDSSSTGFLKASMSAKSGASSKKITSWSFWLCVGVYFTICS